MLEILIAIIPIFVLVAAGYIFMVLKIAKRSWIKVLNNFVFYVSLPALIIYNFSGIDWTQSDAPKLVLANFIYLTVSAIIILPIVSLLPFSKKSKSAVYLATIVGNAVYLGIPLVTRILEKEGTTDVSELIVFSSVVQLVGSMLVSLIAIEYFFLKSKDFRQIGRRMGKNPLVIAILVGLAMATFSKMSWFEQSVAVPLKMLAGTASPVALFVLGGFLFGRSLGHKKHLVVVASALKLILLPLIAWVFIKLLGISYPLSTIAVLMAAMPVAVTAFVLSEAYELDTATVAAIMMVTTVLSLLTIPGLTALLRA